jgi:hypothetical protein
MTHTYYECLTHEGQPATAAQRRAYGTASYGYPSRKKAEQACPNGAMVSERHADHGADWAGRAVSYRDASGVLHVVVPHA